MLQAGICSSTVIRFASLGSGASPATVASALEGPTVPVIALGVVAEASVVCANGSPLPRPPTKAVDLCFSYRALRDSRAEASGVAPTMGLGLGVALCQISSSVAKEFKKPQWYSKAKMLTVWSIGSIS